MKTLSNAELQDAIDATARLVGDRNPNHYAILLVHLENLTDEQRKRATDELTLEPMEPVPGRVDFDARVRGQDGPEWVEWGGGDPCPVKIDTLVEIKHRDGEVFKTRCPEGHRWNHIGSGGDVIAYRDWTAWEQSK